MLFFFLLVVLFFLRFMALFSFVTIPLDLATIILIMVILLIFYFFPLRIMPSFVLEKYFLFREVYYLPFLERLFFFFFDRSAYLERFSFILLRLRYLRVLICLYSNSRFLRFMVHVTFSIPLLLLFSFFYYVVIIGVFPFYVLILNALYVSLKGGIENVVSFVEEGYPARAGFAYFSMKELVLQWNRPLS